MRLHSKISDLEARQCRYEVPLNFRTWCILFIITNLEIVFSDSIYHLRPFNRLITNMLLSQFKTFSSFLQVYKLLFCLCMATLTFIFVYINTGQCPGRLKIYKIKTNNIISCHVNKSQCQTTDLHPKRCLLNIFWPFARCSSGT